MKSKWILVAFFLLSITSHGQDKWPTITNETKPWTRWWWLGSAVDQKGLDDNLSALQKAGIGGVEITPIYGITGEEHRFLNFLSKPWLDAFSYTLKRSAQLGLGVDLANATGWPFGGPWVTDEDASRSVYYKMYKLSGGNSLTDSIYYDRAAWVRTANTKSRQITEIKQPISSNTDLQQLALDQVQFPGKLPLVSLMAYNAYGQGMDLTARVGRDGKLNWTAPAGEWRLYALFTGLHGKMVERAAPGGEGYAIDHFSRKAAENYFKPFDEAFKGMDLKHLRGFFNDSYEVDDARGQANWTTDLLEEFKQRKGYDLREHLPALFGNEDPDRNNRVIYDYRTVIDELILNNFTHEWRKWGNKQGKLLRNQSHGSPANTLDLYSVVDVPETEGTEPLRFKFASSAGHVTGKRLVSAEACTWLNEHFLSNWGDVKKSLDKYFLGGVNHIVYHGNAYSPTDAAWPGWNFYAAVHFQPTNPQWKQFDQLNTYVTRIQSFLQQGKPDHQVLLYYPIVDRYMQGGNALLQHFDGMEKNFEHTPFEEIAVELQAQGYGFDFFSDRQLMSFTNTGAAIQTPGSAYKTIVIPAVTWMDIPTLNKLDKLIRNGATVIFYDKLPKAVPGLHDMALRQEAMADILSSWKLDPSGISRVGMGKVIIGKELTSLLDKAAVSASPFEKAGLFSFGKITSDKRFYFVVNRSDKTIDTLVNIPTFGFQHIQFFDPMSGAISTVKSKDGRIRIQLRPFASIIVSMSNKLTSASMHAYDDAIRQRKNIDMNWTIRFIDGGPILPQAKTLPTVDLWTNFGDSSYTNFSGTAIYTSRFSIEQPETFRWKLDLGTVHSTAEVWINEQKIGELTGPDFSIDIPRSVLKTDNQIEVHVSNLMANRISYMDRNNILWKKFYNINMSARIKDNLKNGIFDAGAWKPQPSGLKGPVQLMAY